MVSGSPINTCVAIIVSGLSIIDHFIMSSSGIISQPLYIKMHIALLKITLPLFVPYITIRTLYWFGGIMCVERFYYLCTSFQNSERGISKYTLER